MTLLSSGSYLWSVEKSHVVCETKAEIKAIYVLL